MGNHFARLLTTVLALSGAIPQATQDKRPHVVKVENRGLLFTDNDAGVNGTDAGYSLSLGDRTLWLFGDVFLQNPTTPEKPFIGSVSNCALLVPKGKGAAHLKAYTFLKDSNGSIARQVIPRLSGEDDKTRLWPFGGWYDATVNRAYQYYSRIKVTGDGPLDFRSEGMGLASSQTTKPEEITFQRVAGPEGDIWWPAEKDKPVFGSAVIADGPDANEQMLYVVGYRDQPFGKIGRLARVPKSRIGDLNAYEYFSGTPQNPSWSRLVSDSVDIASLNGFPTELSVSYNRFLGGYLAVYTVNLSEKLRLALAPKPWGPYKTIGEIDARHQPFVKAMCYAGKEHPELAEDGGRIVYVTYVDGSRYWLQLLKVTLAN